MSDTEKRRNMRRGRSVGPGPGDPDSWPRTTCPIIYLGGRTVAPSGICFNHRPALCPIIITIPVTAAFGAPGTGTADAVPPRYNMFMISTSVRRGRRSFFAPEIYRRRRWRRRRRLPSTRFETPTSRFVALLFESARYHATFN